MPSASGTFRRFCSIEDILRFIMITKQIMIDIKRRNLQTFSRNKFEQREVINLRIVRKVLQEAKGRLKQDVKAHYNKSLLC